MFSFLLFFCFAFVLTHLFISGKSGAGGPSPPPPPPPASKKKRDLADDSDLLERDFEDLDLLERDFEELEARESIWTKIR